VRQGAGDAKAMTDREWDEFYKTIGYDPNSTEGF
jgi:hypothetical protein